MSLPLSLMKLLSPDGEEQNGSHRTASRGNHFFGSSNTAKFACVHMCSVVSNSLWPHELYPARLLCLWNFPGKNTRADCHFLLQGIFPTQESNPCLLHFLSWQAYSLPVQHLGNPNIGMHHFNFFKCISSFITHKSPSILVLSPPF